MSLTIKIKVPDVPTAGRQSIGDFFVFNDSLFIVLSNERGEFVTAVDLSTGNRWRINGEQEVFIPTSVTIDAT